MKKIYKLLTILIATVAFGGGLQAQIFFTQDFQGTMGANGIPATWTETGLSTDGIYMVGTSVQANSAGFWPVPAHTNFAMSNDDACNCDKSVDRLILPTQNFVAITGGLELIVDLYQDGLYGNAGDVQVSINGGTTWTTIYAIPSVVGWQDNTTISLNAFVGQSAVMIAFRENDNAQWATGLAVDNVRLNQTASSVDAALTNSSPREYTLMPLAQTIAMPVEATVSNVGTTTIATASVTTNIYLAPNFTTPVTTLNGTATALAAGASSNITMGTFTPAGAGGYLFEHIVSAVGDPNAINDTLFYGLTVTDSIYARDNATASAAIGVNGVGNTATLGNVFEARANQTLSTVTFATNGVGAGPALGDTTQVLLYATTGGVPSGAPLATSAFFIYTAVDTGAVVRTVQINGATGLDLVAGTKYFVGLKEFATTDNLGTFVSDEIFTPNTTFASIDGGAWTPLETFGFPNPALLRANFASSCSTFGFMPTTTDASCGIADGTATANPSGGTAPYTYVWDANAGGQTTATATGLAAGTYIVNVTDNVGCTGADTITVVNPNAPTGATSATNPSCGTPDGTATATGSGGTAPYTYQWSANAGSQTTATATALGAGTYTVIITDAASCAVTLTVTLTTPAGPSSAAVETAAVSCNGAADGEATATAAGGTAPYTYLWSAAAANQTTSTATGLTAGTYDVTITDANGCTSTSSAIVTEPTAVTATVVDNLNGTATATPAGGTAPYTYLWDDAAAQTTATATGLNDNQLYTVTITDANGCTATATVTATLGLEDLANTMEVIAFPNPAGDQLTIVFTFNTNEDATIRLYNNLGQIVETSSLVQVLSGQLELNTAGIAAGMYRLEVATSHASVTKQIVIAH